LNLVEALDRSRFRPIVVLASDGPLTERLRAAGIETIIEPLDSSIIETRKDSLGKSPWLHLMQGWICFNYALRIARLARKLGADLIHTNSLKSDLYGGIAGRIAVIPTLWHVRDSINDQYLPAKAATIFRLLARVIPMMVVANSESTLRTLRPLRGQAAATVYSGVGDRALTTGKGINGKLAVVHDGYSDQQFPTSVTAGQSAPSDFTFEAKAPVIALVGRIAEWKGQHIFIAAAAQARLQFPQVRFWIVGAPLFGESEYEQSLHRQVSELNLEDSVNFLGFQEDIPAILAQVDIVVHASTLGEPFGQVVIEGMAAGKPIIATDGGALPEIVLPGETGLLVPMGNAVAMADAIRELLSHPEQAMAMGDAGRLRVRRRFTISHTARRLEDIYDFLLEPLKSPTVTALWPETGQTYRS